MPPASRSATPPYQEIEEQFSEIERQSFRQAVHFIDTDGSVARGAEAVFRVMARCGWKRWLLWLYHTVPLFARAAEATYDVIAARRGEFTALYRIWYGKNLRPPTYHLSVALFLRILGGVYLIAFVSLWAQVGGLIGDRGILPAQAYLDGVEQVLPASASTASLVWNVPTLAWISAQDGFLHLICGLGTLFSVLLILGVVPIPSLILLWLGYLSLFHVGQAFLSFQWDTLLLETGFLSIFVAPLGVEVPLVVRPPSASPGNLAAVVAVVPTHVRVGRGQANVERFSD